MRDPYEALGVKPDASASEIKKAYRKLAKRYHPDSTGGDKAKEDRFKEVSTAYDIVGDPDKRAKYDAMRKQGAWGGMHAPGAEAGAGAAGFDLGDLFAQMFGGAAGPAGGRASGAGAGGGGAGEASGPGGVRYRVYTTNSPGGFQESFFTESPFGGAESPFDFGRQPPRRKRSTRSRPGGARAEAGAAAPAERRVRLSDGTSATQRGSDIYSNVRIAIDQAVLGTVAEVPTLTGKASVKIPPATSSGVKLRLKGRGADKPGGGRGDHFVTVQIDVPKNLDDTAKRHLVAFMERVRGGSRGDNT